MISAESKYWLWINGELAIFEGQLKRDRKNETYFDVVDLAPFLQKGENIIAVQVWYWGREGFAHHDSGQPGLLFHAKVGEQEVKSDSTWKILKNPAYEHSSEGGQPNFRLSEWNVRYNASKNTASGWQSISFNDSNWESATVVNLKKVTSWQNMVKRPFPNWKDSGLLSYVNSDSFPKYGNGQIIEAVLPYDARVSAYLKVKSPAGKVINIETDQYDGWYAFGAGPANRAEYITKDGIQEFETKVWMSGNIVEYFIPEGVEIVSLKYRELGYPSEFVGSFSCNDTFYNQLWTMARRTLYINMFDNFMDCPDRERALWWGDVVNQSGECFYTLDTVSHALIRKSIKTLVDWQREDSTLYSPTSTLWNSELPQQMLASIGWYGFWNYFMNTNDSTTIREVYPAVRKYLSIWKMKPNGLVEHRRGAWDWGDWGKNIDIEILDNTWYYLALKAAVPMAKLSGFSQDTANYLRRMESIEANFIDAFWKEDEQYFISDWVKTPDDRANAMVINAGLAKSEHFDGIKKVLTENQFASPYMEKYVLEALCKIGSETIALERMKQRYTEMVNSKYNTLWEVWSGLKEGTINHGWNAPNTVLSQNIAGLTPLEPGWSVYSVFPKMGTLLEIEQVVPSIKGNIGVQYKLDTKSFEIILDSPNNTTAIVGIPKQYMNKAIIKLNGRKVYKKGKFFNKIDGLVRLEDDNDYIRFSVTPGKWHFLSK